MRHVYPNHEIPHLWAHQSQDEARNSTGSLYFQGPTIFSYGSHFPIARHVTNLRADRAVLFTTAHHSVTTSGHCSAVASAIPPNVPVFHVPHLRSSSAELPDHADNVESYVHRISELLGKAKRARVNRDWLEREALALREQLRGYVAFFDLIAALPESNELDELEAWIREHEAEERQRREEAARIAERVRRRDQAEQIQRFLAGDPYASDVAGVSRHLRGVRDADKASLMMRR